MNSSQDTPSSSNHTPINTMSGSVDHSDDPMYIHPGDSPALVLVQPLLDGNNYHSWSRTFRRALESKNKTGFITGNFSKPVETNRRFAAWTKANNMVASWIVNSVVPSIAQSVMWFDNAFDIWNDLKDRYGNADVFRLSDLQEQFYATRQRDSSVTEYYTRLKVLWEELMVLRAIPSCTCNRCTCNVSSQINKFIEDDHVIRFIKGLNDEFEPVKSQVLLSSPLPDVKTTFAMAVKLERKLQYSAGQSQFSGNQPLVFYANGPARQGNYGYKYGNPSGGKGAKKDYQNQKYGYNAKAPVCTFCNMVGHTVDKCYRKHGFPPGYKGKGQVNCVGNEANAQQDVLGTNQSEQESCQGSEVVNDSVSHSVFPFSQEQCMHLISMLQEYKDRGILMSPAPAEATNNHHTVLSAQQVSNSGKWKGEVLSNISNIWILDSGATDHICCSLSLFESYQPVFNVSVKLPNGQSINVDHIGTVNVLPHLKLDHVFHIPSFTFNLLSLSKLTVTGNINLFFHSNVCSIQDHTSKKTIGTARVLKGLYHLLIDSLHIDSLPLPSHVLAVSSPMSFVWHSRLGHQGTSRMREINKIDPSVDVNFDSESCTICPLAKQKRLPFPVSHSVSHSPFFLLHIDIWDPYKHPTLYQQRYFLSIVDDYSRYCWIYLMKAKSETRCIVESFWNFVLT